MKPSLRRLAFFSMAVVLGAAAFSFFWSAKVEAYGVGGGGSPAPCNANANVSMCYTPTNTTVPNVPPTNQSQDLATGKYMCFACPTTGVGG